MQLSGFTGTKKGDIYYESMFDYFGIVWEEPIAQHYEEFDTNKEIAWVVAKNRNQIFQARRELLPAELKTEIKVNWLYKGVKSEQQAETRGLDKQQIKNVFMNSIP